MSKPLVAVVLALGCAGLQAVGSPVTPAARFSDAVAGVSAAPAPSGSVPAPPAAMAVAMQTFTDRAAFTALFPGLPVEDFEEGNAAAGAFLVCDAPLGAAGSVPCGFAAGEILTGVSFQDNPGPDAGSLVLLGPGTSLNPTQALVANTFADAFDVVFNPPVSAAGMDLHSTAAPGVGDPDTVTIQVYDGAGTLIGTFPSVAASGPGSFWGIASPTPIGRVSLLSTNNRAEGVDNVAFGAAAFSGIPALGKSGLAVLSVVLAAAALWVIRMRAA